MFGYPGLSRAAARLERLAERWLAERPRVLSPRRMATLSVAIKTLLAELRLGGSD